MSKQLTLEVILFFCFFPPLLGGCTTKSATEFNLNSFPSPALVDHIYATLNGVKIEAVRTNLNNTNWQVIRYNDKPTRDHRANADLILKILELAKVQKPNPTDQNIPWFTLTASATLPKQVTRIEQTIKFNDHQNLVAKTLEQRSPLDFRDRKISSFDPDDVNDLQTRGRCKPIKLYRDGDRWISKGIAKVDPWLQTALALKYNDLADSLEDETKYALDPKPSCVLELKGLRGKSETIAWYRENNSKKWVVTNSSLPSKYLVDDAKVLGL